MLGDGAERRRTVSHRNETTSDGRLEDDDDDTWRESRLQSHQQQQQHTHTNTKEVGLLRRRVCVYLGLGYVSSIIISVGGISRINRLCGDGDAEVGVESNKCLE